MSEEEVINILQHYLETEEFDNAGDFLIAIDKIIDLYQKEKEKNKRQAEHIQGINKRNENLRIHLKLLQAHRLKKYMMDNYVSKDKIREKIDKYEKDFERQDKENLFNMTKITAGKLSSLKELLEEENNEM